MNHTPFLDILPTPTIRSVRNGLWSTGATWDLNRRPIATDVVHVEHSVTIRGGAETVDQISIRPGGWLTLSAREIMKLHVSTLQVLPGAGLSGGTMEHGLRGWLIFKPGPRIDPAVDPDSLGCGLVVEGTCKLLGRLIADRRPRIAKPPKSGDTFIALKDPPHGWEAGDRFLLPDTEWRAYMAEHEGEGDPFAAKHQFRVVTEVTEEGLHFDPPLIHSNTYPDEADGSKKYMGRIANLTASFYIASKAPNGVRGHTIYTGHADVTLDGIGFRDLGRTRGGKIDPAKNHIGRYPVHFHHCMGPETVRPSGYQFVMQNCVVERSKKWPVTIHGAMSSWGVVSDNVIWDAEFDGIATETGSEYQTRIERNFIGNIHNGSCIWHRSRLCPTNDNYCHGAIELHSKFLNQAGNPHDSGGIYYQGLGDRIQPGEPAAVLSGKVDVPRFAGTCCDDAEDLIPIIIDTALIAECRGNEFVCCNHGVELDHLKQSPYPQCGAQKHLISDTVGWNGWGPPVTGYDTFGHHIDGMISKAHGNEFSAGTQSTDWGTVWSKFNIHTPDPTGVAMLINVPQGTYIIEDCVLVANEPVKIARPWVNELHVCDGIPRGLHIIFRRCLMTPINGGLDIIIVDPYSPPDAVVAPFSVKVEDHQGVRGDNRTIEETFL